MWRGWGLDAEPRRCERVVVGRGNVVLPPGDAQPGRIGATMHEPLQRAAPIRGKVNASGPIIEN